ncbi:hypothetical protein [Gelidibacter maritimus]|uniref:Sugar transporter n=1 Tax=Gelidibacter maritimus TaxID=2761487 RepID=A0A7W2M819_9FLAO|nr:hypothetical protein [Gelidibacter maritimus]MBA6154447.1 hypothetical protein [Gelidibacter maritimus]
MNLTSSKKPPVYFWIVGIIALLWNLFGVYNYVMQAFVTTEQRTQFSQAQHNLYDDLPIWYVSIFAIAVFAGLFAAISWLLRKRWAYTLFIISFLAVGAQQFYVLTEINPRDIFLPLTSIVIAVFLVWFSKRAIARKWLI